MRLEPELDKGRLSDLLSSDYRLEVADLTFVPYGIDSWSYVAVCRDGSRAFVKLKRRGLSTDAAASDAPLLAALAAEAVPVPRPIARSDGGYASRFDGYEVLVFEYLDGHSLEDEAAWPDELYAAVAGTVAAVHASTDAVRHMVERRERYELPFVGPLVDALAVVESGRSRVRRDAPTFAALRQMVIPRVGDLHHAIRRLGELRDLSRVRGTDEVLCHTDIWGSNLLRSDDGTLHLLDWDSALLGPPEGDLFMFAGTDFFPADRFGWFLGRYEAAFRHVRLDPATFGFYFYRRNLEDLAGFVGSIVDDEMQAMGPTATLDVVASLLAEVSRLEGRIRHAAEVLSLADRATSGRSGPERGQ